MPVRLRSALALAAAVVLGACQAHAQQDTPRYPVLDPSALRTGRIAAREDSFAILLAKDGRVATAGSMVARTRLDTIDREPVIVRTEVSAMVYGEVETDSFAMARADLAPHMVRGWGGRVRSDLRFAGGRVTGTVDDRGERRDVSEQVGGALYANETDVLLQALPLAPGYAASVRRFDPVHGLEWTNLRVVDAEEVWEGGVPIRAWRVEVEHAGRTATYWVDRGTGAMLRWSFVSDGTEMRIVRVPRRAAEPAAPR